MKCNLFRTLLRTFAHMCVKLHGDNFKLIIANASCQCNWNCQVVIVCLHLSLPLTLSISVPRVHVLLIKCIESIWIDLYHICCSIIDLYGNWSKLKTIIPNGSLSLSVWNYPIKNIGIIFWLRNCVRSTYWLMACAPSIFLISFGRKWKWFMAHELCINFYYLCTLYDKSQVHVRILKIYTRRVQSECASFDDSTLKINCDGKADLEKRKNRMAIAMGMSGREHVYSVIFACVFPIKTFLR